MMILQVILQSSVILTESDTHQKTPTTKTSLILRPSTLLMLKLTTMSTVTTITTMMRVHLTVDHHLFLDLITMVDSEVDLVVLDHIMEEEKDHHSKDSKVLEEVDLEDLDHFRMDHHSFHHMLLDTEGSGVKMGLARFNMDHPITMGLIIMMMMVIMREIAVDHQDLEIMDWVLEDFDMEAPVVPVQDLADQDLEVWDNSVIIQMVLVALLKFQVDPAKDLVADLAEDIMEDPCREAEEDINTNKKKKKMMR